MNIKESIFCIILLVAIVWGLVTLVYNIGIWRSPCVNVYNNGELIYTGTSWHIHTETRGAATYYSQTEQKKWFPRIEKEIVSDKIIIETIKCTE